MDQMENIFDFVDHKLSAPTLQLCHHGMKAAVNNAYVTGHGCVPTKLFIKTDSGLDLVPGP